MSNVSALILAFLMLAACDGDKSDRADSDTDSDTTTTECADGDGDGVCDSEDPCPNDDPDDSDGDGVCDSEDPCPNDDPDDSDGDGVCDSEDPCPNDDPDDSDGDGVCNGDDVCAGFDDDLDQDGDGNPDDCDPCPTDPNDDSDGDGACDGVDVCPGGDDTVDADSDGVPDFCDACPNGDVVEVPTDFALIQDAIDAVCATGTVHVLTGSYAENIDVNRPITLTGDGPGFTMIDGGANGTSAVRISAAATVANLTITNGSVSGDGGGVYVSSAGAIIDNVVVDANSASGNGGGVYALGGLFRDVVSSNNIAISRGGGFQIEGAVTLVRVIVENNTASNGGAGIRNEGTLVAVDSAIDNNDSPTFMGAGLYNGSSASAVFSNTRLSGNTSGQEGTALYVSGTVELYDCDVSDNHGTAGGAAYVRSNGSLYVERTRFAFNSASCCGGAIRVYEGIATIRSSIFLANDASRGGAVEADGGTVDLENATLVGNSNSVEFDDTTATLTNVTISHTAGAAVTVSAAIPIFNPTIAFTNVWSNGTDFVGVADPTGANGNIAVNPYFLRHHPELSSTSWDLHLHPQSLLIDAGAPAILDSDGSTSDIGAFGGPAHDAAWYADADADGMYDGWEAEVGLDPLTDDSVLDLDADGADNGIEFDAGTRPDLADTDLDGINDGDDAAPLDPTIQ